MVKNYPTPNPIISCLHLLLLLLSDATGEHLLEGLVTNFFAIDAEGCLLTAPAHLVLHGHMRALVIAAERAQRAASTQLA